MYLLHGTYQLENKRYNILAALQPLKCYFFPSLSDQNSKCKNEGGSFRCDCRKGYKKVGAACKGKHRD